MAVILGQSVLAGWVAPVEHGCSSAPRATSTIDDLAGAACSFAATAVVMADGTTKAISQIRVGDYVLPEDPETGERGPRKVTHPWQDEDTVVDLEIDGDLITEAAAVLVLFLAVSGAGEPDSPAPLESAHDVSAAIAALASRVPLEPAGAEGASEGGVAASWHDAYQFQLARTNARAGVRFFAPNTADVGLSTRGLRPAPGTRVRPGGVPEGWRIDGTRSAGGTRYYDPTNPGNAVRVMQGNPNSPYATSQSPYVRWQQDGHALDAFGNKLPTPKHPDAHIPLEDFSFLPELFG